MSATVEEDKSHDEEEPLIIYEGFTSSTFSCFGKFVVILFLIINNILLLVNKKEKIIFKDFVGPSIFLRLSLR